MVSPQRVTTVGSSYMRWNKTENNKIENGRDDQHSLYFQFHKSRTFVFAELKEMLNK